MMMAQRKAKAAAQLRAAELGLAVTARPEGTSAALYFPAPFAPKAVMRPRHWWLLLLFIGVVALPPAAYGWYLFTAAADQYESNAGFSSRTENTPTAFDFLGAIVGSSTSSSSDMDIVFQFIRSQELVKRVDAKLNLRKVFSRPTQDPLMRFDPGGSMEDLLAYWQSMVVPTFERSTGLMTLTVWAFDPKDAQNIATEVLAQSTAIINDLSRTAQADTTRYSQNSLATSEKRMAAAQQALTNFRVTNGILDPAQQASGTAQVVNTMVQQLATAQIDLDLLSGTVPDSDPRLAQLNRRIGVIQNRIAAEQAKVGGLSDPGAPIAVTARFSWVLDPIDGTNNYALGIPHCAISLALLENGVPAYGVIYDLSRRVLLHGGPGLGAWDGERALRVNTAPPTKETLIGFHSPFDKTLLPLAAGVLAQFKIRGLGTATLHLAYVAAGLLDGCVDFNVKIWDLAAAIPLVQAAGGEVCFLNGEQFPMRQFDLKMKKIIYCAGSPAMCVRLRELMKA